MRKPKVRVIKGKGKGVMTSQANPDELYLQVYRCQNDSLLFCAELSFLMTSHQPGCQRVVNWIHYSKHDVITNYMCLLRDIYKGAHSRCNTLSYKCNEIRDIFNDVHQFLGHNPGKWTLNEASNENQA